MPMTTITVRISREFIEDENIADTKTIVQRFFVLGAGFWRSGSGFFGFWFGFSRTKNRELRTGTQHQEPRTLNRRLSSWL